MTLNAAPGPYAPDGPAARRVRERLEQERRTRAAQLAVWEGPGGAPADEATFAQADTARRTLEEVEAALARLERGGYGLCEGCEKPIPEGRLEILPYARCCVRCQQRRR